MTYVLDRDDARRMRRRPFRVWLSGVPEGAAFMTARAGDQPAPGASSPRPSLLTVHDVATATTIRLSPAPRTPSFPPGSVVDLRLEFSRSTDAEGEEVLIRGVDVSGLPFRDLLTVTPEGGDLALRAIEIVPDEPMGTLAAAARSAARARLSRERAGRRLDLRIVVDPTASMAPAVADGTVQGVVDVLAGLSAVIGSDRPVEVHVASDPSVRLPPVAPADLATATVDALRRTAPGCGFAGSRVPLADGAAGMTYVITDAVPPDAAGLAERVGRLGARAHLVLLGPDDGLRSPRGIPATTVDPAGAGLASVEALLATPALLGEVVESLLTEVATAPGHR